MFYLLGKMGLILISLMSGLCVTTSSLSWSLLKYSNSLGFKGQFFSVTMSYLYLISSNSSLSCQPNWAAPKEINTTRRQALILSNFMLQSSSLCGTTAAASDFVRRFILNWVFCWNSTKLSFMKNCSSSTSFRVSKFLDLGTIQHLSSLKP